MSFPDWESRSKPIKTNQNQSRQIKTTSRQIQTTQRQIDTLTKLSRLTSMVCWNWESLSKPLWDKSRPCEDKSRQHQDKSRQCQDKSRQPQDKSRQRRDKSRQRQDKSRQPQDKFRQHRDKLMPFRDKSRQHRDKLIPRPNWREYPPSLVEIENLYQNHFETNWDHVKTNRDKVKTNPDNVETNQASSRGLVVKAEDSWPRGPEFKPPLWRPFFQAPFIWMEAWNKIVEKL
jgi:hypothetical protein